MHIQDTFYLCDSMYNKGIIMMEIHNYIRYQYHNKYQLVQFFFFFFFINKVCLYHNNRITINTYYTSIIWNIYYCYY